MKGKASVQIDAAIIFARLRHGNCGPHLVIEFFEKWNDHVQTVGGAALEDRDQDLMFPAILRGCTQKPGRRSAQACHREGRAAKKVTACKQRQLLLKSGERM